MFIRERGQYYIVSKKHRKKTFKFISLDAIQHISRRLLIFASSSDWSIALYASAVIGQGAGQSNYCGFVLTTGAVSRGLVLFRKPKNVFGLTETVK